MKQDLSIQRDGGLLVFRVEKFSMYLRIHLRFFYAPRRRIPSIPLASKVPFHNVRTMELFLPVRYAGSV
ncbi:TPA: hypothetical protein DDZ06_02365 [Candidatus Uhrbacteria bacterium]|nr:hypothetical protein [Candidatus Uhrbacteria bacterium]